MISFERQNSVIFVR